MTLPLPSDPYAALGVSKDADLGTIKATYKKLVLKCHPDKFPDESLKARKQEEFQKIQQAYEIIGDENERARYDAQVRLAELRQDALDRKRRGSDPRVDVRTTSTNYKVRTAEPPAGFYTASGPTAETRSRSYEDAERYYEEQRASSRKYEGYEQTTPRRSPRVDREERTRSEKKKTKERDERRERSSKYASYVEADDDSDHFESSSRRRDDEVRRKADEARRRAEEGRREADDKARKQRRDTAEYTETYDTKLRDRVAGVKEYIERSKGGPQTTRTYEVKREKPIEVRRSRASRERRTSRERERKPSYPEIVEEPAEWRPPTMEKSNSSPANIRIPTRLSPNRSRTEYEVHDAPPPRLHRADSEPIRRKEASHPQPSKLREATVVDSGYSSPTTPEQYSPTSKAKTYRYTPASGGVPLATTVEDHDYSNGHRTILREPGRFRARSPSPMREREPKHERVVPPSGSRTVPVPAPPVTYTTSAARPPIPHASASRVEELREERGRDRSRRGLYGEVTDSTYRRVEKPTSGAYKVDGVKYAKRYGPEDVQWSSAYNAGYEAAKRDLAKDGWDDGRPRMGRSATYVY